MITRKWTALVASSVLLLSTLVAACSSDEGNKDSVAADRSTSTTMSAEQRGSDAAYRDSGDYEVGSTEMSLADGRRVAVWYPADDSASVLPKDQVDLAGFLNETLQSKIPADKRPLYEVNAHRGAEASPDGPFPIVLFSHGYAGFPEQSADIVTHLASWGFVVVAPDHVERSIDGILGTASQGVPKLSDPVVLKQALDKTLESADDENSPLSGLVDADHVAVAGHSAGASAAYLLAGTDKRVKAFISYSVGIRDGDNFRGAPPVPEVPGMIMAGSTDGIIPVAESRSVYNAMEAPKYWVEIANAGHLVFSDICLIGRDQGGLVGLVKQIGLDLPGDLLKLASDGCEPGDLDPLKAFPAIDHLSVAFLRNVFGIDKKPVGLDPSVTKNFKEADVVLESDPS